MKAISITCSAPTASRCISRSATLITSNGLSVRDANIRYKVVRTQAHAQCVTVSERKHINRDNYTCSDCSRKRKRRRVPVSSDLYSEKPAPKQEKQEIADVPSKSRMGLFRDID